MIKATILIITVMLASCQNIPKNEQADVFIHRGLTGIPKHIRTLERHDILKARLPMCASNPPAVGVDLFPIIDKVEGFTSRMKGFKPANNSKELERFAATFSKAATQAHVLNDDPTKRLLIETLANWASAGALLQTESCIVNGEISSASKCKEWRKPDGSDLAPIKDATFVTFIMVGLNRVYRNLLESSHSELTDEHNAIKKWLGQDLNLRLKKPDRVYFGLNMGWYWPSIDNDLANGNINAARHKVRKVLSEIALLINNDGSIENRTTRGNRSLWYHFSGVHEIVMSLEYAHSLDIPIDPNLENKLHSAVTVFLNGYTDKSFMMKWAQKAHNAKYSGPWQDWDDKDFRYGDQMTSWISVYTYRYPKHPNALSIRQLVPEGSVSATRDIDYGFGAGCLYDAASILRESSQLN